MGSFIELKEKYSCAVIKGNGKQLMIPGLIDAHSHGKGLSFIQKGIPYDFLENCLIDWALAVNIDPELSSMLCAIRHIKSGCTTIHHNEFGIAEDPEAITKAEKTISGYKKSGIRLAYSPDIRNINILAYDDVEFLRELPPELQNFANPMVFNDKNAAIDTYFETFEELYKKYNTSDMKVIFGPSWVQGSTEEFLIKIKERADELGKIPIHIHTLQTSVQKAYGIRKYQKSLVEYLNDLGLIDENLVLGHAVYLTESDIEILVSGKSSITHHPSCNLAMRNGISPVYNLVKEGVNVALGIDDKGINDDDDAIMELRMIYYLHRVSSNYLNIPPLDVFETLKMGTTNAARVCGFDGEIGALNAGMKADLVLIDLEEALEGPWASADLSIPLAFIHRAKSNHVNTVIVGGKVLMEDHKIRSIDVDLLYKEVRKQASKGLTQKQKSYAEQLAKIKPYSQKRYNSWISDVELEPFYTFNSKV